MAMAATLAAALAQVRSMTPAEAAQAELQTGADEAIERYSPHVPFPRQRAFLDLPDFEAFYGGAAGGGKSDALLMGAIMYADVPGYHAIIFRRTTPNVRDLIDRSMEWFSGHAQWNGNTMRWTFPSGARLSFGHLQHAHDVHNYKGPAYQYVGWDELTEFLESQYTYLISRVRRPLCAEHKGSPQPLKCQLCAQIGNLAYVPLRVRATSNPDGIGRLWVKKRFVSDEAARAVRSGDYQTVYYKDGPHGRTPFVPSRAEDNIGLDVDQYVNQSLAGLAPVTREQLRYGDWLVAVAGLIKPEWLRYYNAHGDYLQPLTAEREKLGNPIAANTCQRFATIDTAGTEKHLLEEKKRDRHSWSVIAIWDLWVHDGNPWLFLRHVWRDKVGFNALVQAVRDQCGRQSVWKPRRIHIEDAHFGRPIMALLGPQGEGLAIETLKTITGDNKGESGRPGKVERSTQLQIMLERGQVFLPQFENSWRPELEGEWLAWTGDPEEVNDQVDAASYAAIVAKQSSMSWGGVIDTSAHVSMQEMARGGSAALGALEW